MILRAGKHTFPIKRKGLTFETFTRLYAQARLTDNLTQACEDLKTQPPKLRARQREKISRLETRLRKAQEVI